MTDNGYFPRGRSILRRVHGERIVGLLYGGRGLLIGACEPLTYTGTALSSTSLYSTPFRRLTHTATVFETVFFGTREDADRQLAMVHKMHSRVNGVLPEAAGRVPAGTSYDAFDPMSMLWTLGCIADSGRALYEAFARPLAADEREALWQDYRRFGELFGMRDQDLPRSYDEFADYWQGMLTGGDLELTDDARRAGADVAFHVPMGRVRELATRMPMSLLLLGTVPKEIRKLYGVTWTPAHDLAFASAATALRAAHPLLPAAMRRGDNQPFFDLVARTERERLRAAA